MAKQSSLSLNKALIIANVYVLFSLGLAMLSSRLGDGLFEAWLRISPVVTGLFATGAALLTIRASASQDVRSWQALSVGLGLCAVAELLWVLHTTVSAASISVGADWVWVLGYIPMGVAIQLQLNRYRTSLNWFKVFFAILIGVTLAYLFTTLVVSPLYGSAQLGQGLRAILNILYPSLDVTLVIGSLLVLQSVPGNSPWRIIAIAFLFWVYADLSYAILTWLGGYGINGLSLFSVEIPYNLAYLLLGIACLQAASMARTTQTDASLNTAQLV